MPRLPSCTLFVHMRLLLLSMYSLCMCEVLTLPTHLVFWLALLLYTHARSASRDMSIHLPFSARLIAAVRPSQTHKCINLQALQCSAPNQARPCTSCALDVYFCLAAMPCRGGLTAWQMEQVGINTATAKNTNDTDQVSRLLAENQALRLALSKQQRVLPEAVRPCRC